MHFNSDVKLQISCNVQVTELRVNWSGNSGGGGWNQLDSFFCQPWVLTSRILLSSG